MIKFEILEGVGKITLDRPEKYHSFVREMALKLQGVREYLEQTGVTLPEPEAPAEGEAAAEPAATEVVEGE